MPPPPLIALLGPTGCGKSAVALELALRLGGEVVNCDAFQNYAGIAVASAQPGRELTARAPHHGYGWLDPRVPLGAGAYARAAGAWLDAIAARGKPAILVGGTGFYFEALVRPLPETPARDPAVDARLDRLAARHPRPGYLHRLLRRLDPGAAARLSPRDAARVRRALGYRVQTGRRFSDLRSARAERPAARPARAFFLDLDAELLESRLRERACAMVAGGLAGEAAALRAAGVPDDAPGLRAIGCAEARALLDGALGEPAAIEAITRRSRQYAKRQRTWMRHAPDLQGAGKRVDLAGLETAQAAEEILRRLGGT